MTLADFGTDEIELLLDLTEGFKQKKQARYFDHALENKNIALIFEKPSTRTRCAFSVACHDEGASCEYLNVNDIQLGHKEDIKDTARVLSRMFDGIAFRGHRQSDVEELAKWATVPVWNALTDTDHPTQALADLFTMKENFGGLTALNVTYIGDGRNNVCNALMIACAKMGANFVVGTPVELMPDPKLIAKCRKFAEEFAIYENSKYPNFKYKEEPGLIQVVNDPEEAVYGADCVYTDVWVSMGEEDKRDERYKLLAPWQVNAKLMAATDNEYSIFMHCLPASKGDEVTDEVFEADYSKVFQQAENRLHAIKAVMYATL